MNKWLRSNFDDSTVRNLLAMAAPWMLIGMIVGLVALFYMSCFNGRMFLFSSVLHYYRQVLRN